jgi:hypothetical protein
LNRGHIDAGLSSDNAIKIKGNEGLSLGNPIGSTGGSVRGSVREREEEDGKGPGPRQKGGIFQSGIVESRAVACPEGGDNGCAGEPVITKLSSVIGVAASRVFGL